MTKKWILAVLALCMLLGGCAHPPIDAGDNGTETTTQTEESVQTEETLGREENSGTRDGFKSITDTEDACKYRQELTMYVNYWSILYCMLGLPPVA